MDSRSLDTEKCHGYTFERNGVSITLVDTPGFNDTYKSDTEVLLELAKWLEFSYRKHVQLTGIIYCHRILDVRMDGGAMRNLKMFRKLCGNDPMKNVVMASTFWGVVDQDKAERNESELKSDPEFWGDMINYGTRTARFLDTPESGFEILGMFANMPRVALKLQQELVDENKPLLATAAGHAVNEELAELSAKHTAALLNIQQETAQAIAEKDVEMQAILKKERDKTEKKLRKIENDQEALKAERRDDIRRMEVDFDQKFRLMQLENDKVRATERDTAESRRREDREYAERLRAADRQDYDTRVNNLLAQQSVSSSSEDEPSSGRGTKFIRAAGAVTMSLFNPFAIPEAVIGVVDFLNSI